MPAFTDLTGLAGIAFALAALLIAFPGIRELSRPRLAALGTVTVVLVLIPFGTLPLAAVVRGATGDLSITTLLLLGSGVLRRLTGRSPADPRARLALLGLVAVAALFLYPMALGVGMWDPYRLGYRSPALFGGLLIVALAAWFSRFDAIVLGLALAILAWAVRAYESNNLWDYLLDPLVSFYALGVLARRGADQVLRRFRNTPVGNVAVDHLPKT